MWYHSLPTSANFDYGDLESSVFFAIYSTELSFSDQSGFTPMPFFKQPLIIQPVFHCILTCFVGWDNRPVTRRRIVQLSLFSYFVFSHVNCFRSLSAWDLFITLLFVFSVFSSFDPFTRIIQSTVFSVTCCLSCLLLCFFNSEMFFYWLRLIQTKVLAKMHHFCYC